MVSYGLFRHLKSRNITIVTFFINSEDEMDEAMSYAPYLDGVMTDVPTKVNEYISRIDGGKMKYT